MVNLDITQNSWTFFTLPILYSLIILVFQGPLSPDLEHREVEVDELQVTSGCGVVAPA